MPRLPIRSGSPTYTGDKQYVQEDINGKDAPMNLYLLDKLISDAFLLDNVDQTPYNNSVMPTPVDQPSTTSPQTNEYPH